MNMTLDLSFPHHITGLEKWDGLLRWAVLVPDVVRAPTVCEAVLGAEE